MQDVGPTAFEKLSIVISSESDHLLGSIDRRNVPANQPLANQRDRRSIPAADLQNDFIGPDIEHVDSPGNSFRDDHSSTLLPSRHIQTHSRDENRALDDVLHEIANIQQRHPVIEAGHDQGSKTRSEDRAATADE